MKQLLICERTIKNRLVAGFGQSKITGFDQAEPTPV